MCVIVLNNMPATKHGIIATEGKTEGGGVRKHMFHKHGGAVHSRKQKTIRAERDYIKQAVQVGNGVHNTSVTTPRRSIYGYFVGVHMLRNSHARAHFVLYSRQCAYTIHYIILCDDLCTVQTREMKTLC